MERWYILLTGNPASVSCCTQANNKTHHTNEGSCRGFCFINRKDLKVPGVSWSLCSPACWPTLTFRLPCSKFVYFQLCLPSPRSSSLPFLLVTPGSHLQNVDVIFPSFSFKLGDVCVFFIIIISSVYHTAAAKAFSRKGKGCHLSMSFTDRMLECGQLKSHTVECVADTVGGCIKAPSLSH